MEATSTAPLTNKNLENMNFSNKAICKKDLINEYKQTIEIYKRSINYWTEKGDEIRIKSLRASIEKLKQYIIELNKG